MKDCYEEDIKIGDKVKIYFEYIVTLEEGYKFKEEFDPEFLGITLRVIDKIEIFTPQEIKPIYFDEFDEKPRPSQDLGTRHDILRLLDEKSGRIFLMESKNVEKVLR